MAVSKWFMPLDLGGGPEDSIQESAEKAFESAVKILSLEGLINQTTLYRQWNYVEDIAHRG